MEHNRAHIKSHSMKPSIMDEKFSQSIYRMDLFFMKISKNIARVSLTIYCDQILLNCVNNSPTRFFFFRKLIHEALKIQNFQTRCTLIQNVLYLVDGGKLRCKLSPRSSFVANFVKILS